MEEPGPPSAQTTRSVFHEGVTPWMRSARVQAQNDAQRASGGDGIHQLPAPILVKDAYKEDLQHTEHARKLELEQEEARIVDQIEEQRFKHCRMYFIVGCFGLPLLLFVNVIHFCEDFNAESGSFRIRTYLWLSVIVGLLQSFLWILWFTAFRIVDSITFDLLSIYNSTVPFGYLV
ncbi:hypothetical protein BWQ96_06756 [Gracilariopsis chorda]|uniref:Gamma-secretase subunit PEN-2 n=1 Tax=Gracilariopsis chorda TaxID=448386 RepID=A0A2V3IN17_9FLOR|nr:hypothetical protein BWQ96_06756 [Gracilariopsis chorda]|eukprot:PXF43463.1 hypothetical protein BWQ96_06756 [Gracilariopsis chorda]